MGDIALSDESTESAGAQPPLALADESAFDLQVITAGNTKIKVLPGGCLYCIEDGEIQLNQILASPLAGGIQRVLLRLNHPGSSSAVEPSVVEIVGPRAKSTFSCATDRFIWSGVINQIAYRCVLWLSPKGRLWFFHVEVENRTTQPVDCDAILIQDIGLASRAQCRINEYFTSQYLDHRAVHHSEIGPVLMTRQNLPQVEKTHPWLLQGCLSRAAGFTTDGFDFFGVDFKQTGHPAALARKTIGHDIRQYETGYTALQSAEASVKPGESQRWAFFSLYLPDHPEPSSTADLTESRLHEIRQAWQEMQRTPAAILTSPDPRPSSVFQTATLFKAEDLLAADLNRLFPGPRRHEETIDGLPLSFFHGNEAVHVVLKAREMISPRSHGHIMRSGRGHLPDSEIMSSAFYAPGVFASQLAVGNTVFGKFISSVRDPLNIIYSSGLRIFVRHRPADAWQLLAVPSAFEMAPHFCRWYYKSANEMLTVSCQTAYADAAMVFSVHSNRKPIELLISGEISGGPQEYEAAPQLLVDSRNSRITVGADARSFLGTQQPNIALHLVTSTPRAVAVIGGEELLVAANGNRRLPYLALRTHATRAFEFAMVGAIDGNGQTDALCARYEAASDDQPLKLDGERFWKETTAGLRLASPSTSRIGQINDALRWFARDAVVHYSIPRGLEQSNGGAWGVRDVCQGAVEFLLSYGHGDVVKNILCELFSQQYAQRGDWPQWFMFPPFEKIQSSNCHGDVAIWPLKALCEYLEETGDIQFLDHRLPYTKEETFQKTTWVETVAQHVDRLLEALKSQFLPGLSFPRYGEGDWDDSLQPTRSELAENMVSSWTTALLYQTLRRYAAVLAHFGLEERAASINDLAAKIQADFQRLLLPDGIVAGFAIFDHDHPGGPQYMLHPRDTRTGLRYRLISMTRSIIGGIFSKEQACRHLELIKEYLLYPDGARLMDRPTKYQGGRESVFRRSESASFFGREIGLQYVHAHLRYAEALAAMGRSEELFHALLVVNPIAVTDVVKNARIRQRNCYFSSSDAAFTDRYAASADYDKLREGRIPVDGGWRIYSSGPGIYSNLVIRHLLGIRRKFEFMEFDPVLPRELHDMTCELTSAGKRICYRFSAAPNRGNAGRIEVNGTELTLASRSENPYRPGAMRVRKSDFEAALTETVNQVNVSLV